MNLFLSSSKRIHRIKKGRIVKRLIFHDPEKIKWTRQENCKKYPYFVTDESFLVKCFNNDFQYKILRVRVKLPHDCVLLSLQPLWLRLGISCRWLMEDRFQSNSSFIYDKNTIMTITFVVTVPFNLILRIGWTCYGLDVLKNQLPSNLAE